MVVMKLLQGTKIGMFGHPAGNTFARFVGSTRRTAAWSLGIVVLKMGRLKKKRPILERVRVTQKVWNSSLCD